jgi:RimJ/RimL family protein N-acetyltransferase
MLNTINNTALATATAPSVFPKITGRISESTKHEFKTTRLQMRPVNETDLNDFTALFTDQDVVRFIGIEAGTIPSAQEIGQLLNGAINAWVSRGYGRWAIFNCKTNEFVGFCGFRSEQGIPELICMLHKRFWGQGLLPKRPRVY